MNVLNKLKKALSKSNDYTVKQRSNKNPSNTKKGPGRYHVQGKIN